MNYQGDLVFLRSVRVFLGTPTKPLPLEAETLTFIGRRENWKCIKASVPFGAHKLRLQPNSADGSPKPHSLSFRANLNVQIPTVPCLIFCTIKLRSLRIRGFESHLVAPLQSSKSTDLRFLAAINTLRFCAQLHTV
jgi:hypothetical protein